MADTRPMHERSHPAAIVEIERLRAALKEIAEEPCIESEGNAEIARRALANEQKADES